jgi:RluA family pseudouridine synthase
MDDKATDTVNTGGCSMNVSPTNVKFVSPLAHDDVSNVTPANDVRDDREEYVEVAKPRFSKRTDKVLKRLLNKKQKSSNDIVTKSPNQKFVANTEKHTDVVVEDSLHETDYYFEAGLRKVYPYYYQFTTYAKGRWYGQKLVDVFVKEFQHVTPESFKKSVESMAVTVNGKPTNVDYVLQNGDFITNAIHRHELPVTAEPITVTAESDELLVVNKPSSIPIHPCGRYRHNSVLYILAKEQGYRNLRSIYRLDRLTSGVVIFCKTEAKTKEMMNQIKHRLVEKEYVCRVDGQFPSGYVECDGRIEPFSHKHGIYRVGDNGKESRTLFECMSFNGQTSVVKCKPLTGRTHQIRVHLQYLGFPITNDPIYNGSIWGPNKGKGGDFGKSEEQLMSELDQRHSSSHHYDTYCVPNETPLEDTDHETSSLGSCQVRKRMKVDSLHQSSVVSTYDPARTTYDPECRECQLKFTDPQPSHLIMFLHAYSYKGPGWSFSTALPYWTEANWKAE